MSRRMGWSRSLRFRLTLWYVGTLAGLLLSAGLLVYAGAQHALLAETDAFLRLEARHLTFRSPSEKIELKDLMQEVAGADSEPPPSGSRLVFDVVHQRLSGADGRTLAASPALLHQPALLASLEGLQAQGPAVKFAGPDEERMMRVLTQPVPGVSPPLVLQLAVPWDHNADLLERLGALLAFGLPVILLLAGVGGWLVVSRTLRPIHRIVREAAELDADRLPHALHPPTETDSEIGHLVGTLNGMMERLRLAFEASHRYAQAQQRFAADASHELRTPLTILRGEIELALSRERPAEAYRATLQSALEEIDRMSHIVEALSFLARRDANQIDTQPQRGAVDLAPIARSVFEDLGPVARQQGVELVLEADPKAVVRGDAGQLQLLLRNLADNAVKYTPAGGRVVIEAARHNGACDLAVRDTGIGIRPEDLPHVFDRFWRADPARTAPGSGLGLAICAEIGELHGGAWQVDSQPGQGSRFCLRLPTLEP